MSNSMRSAAQSVPVNSLDDVQTKNIKAGLRGQSSSVRVTVVVKDAMQRHYGSLKAAAISLSMDEGQLSRELGNGDFKFEKLERADDEAKAFIAAALHEALGDPDPKAQARRLIREARARLDELAEAIA